MKKTFPIIVALIAISLLGMIFIQVSWISNSYKVQQEEYKQKINSVLKEVQNKIIADKERELSRLYGSLSLVPSGISTKKMYTTFEVKNLIKTELNKANIKIEFEWCITDEQFGNPIMNSAGFKIEYLAEESNMMIVPIKIYPKGSINPEVLYVYFLNPEYYTSKKLLGLILSSLLFTLVIISAFLITVRALLKQKKIAEIKNDFIANMTHEFKTPIATIGLATDALKNDKVKNDPERVLMYLDIIKEEDKRMNAMVETILQSALLERQELKLVLKKINVHEVINNVYENTNIQVEEKNGTLLTKLQASSTFIKADEVHFTNIVFNLLDNAIKYSKDKPSIEIATENVGNNIHIKFTDNGIGMSKDTLNNIFEKFYRAHTGNLHNVKGFGLGLTYVKQIVDAHEGKIKVTSTIGKGSVFTIILANI